MRILLVDDDVVFAKLVLTKLADLGLRDVTVAHSAEAALALFDQGETPFDCFLLDIVLGNSDGIDLCRILRMRAENKLAPIIMVTSQRGSTLMSRAFSAGATDFLHKPLDHNELVGRIKTAMMLVELTKKAKASAKPLGNSPRRNDRSHEISPLRPVWFPKVKGMVEFSRLQKQLLELRSQNETPTLYRVQINDFGTLFERADNRALKRHLHKVSNVLSEELSEDQILFSYLGQGRFIICLRDQGSSNSSETAVNWQNRANLRLDQSRSPGSIVLKLRISDTMGPFPDSPDAVPPELQGEQSINPSALALDLPQVEDIEDRMFEKALAEEERQDATS